MQLVAIMRRPFRNVNNFPAGQISFSSNRLKPRPSPQANKSACRPLLMTVLLDFELTNHSELLVARRLRRGASFPRLAQKRSDENQANQRGALGSPRTHPRRRPALYGRSAGRPASVAAIDNSAQPRRHRVDARALGLRSGDRLSQPGGTERGRIDLPGRSRRSHLAVRMAERRHSTMPMSIRISSAPSAARSRASSASKSASLPLLDQSDPPSAR